jgi:hypothetical protein
MNYVLDENGNIKIGPNGQPLVVGDDGKEFEIDAIGAQQTITDLHAESAGHRKKASEAAKKLEAFGDIDPVAARQALDTVASLSNDHKLEIETLKTNMNKTWQEKFDAEVAKNSDLSNQLFDAKVTAKFATSEVVKKTVLTPDIAAKVFGSNFNMDGTAKDAAGNIIYSKSKPGEPAEFDEALTIILDAYPAKDAIMRGSGTGGSGAHQSGDGVQNTDLGRFFDKKSKDYSLTEQGKVAAENPEKYKALKAQYT